MGESVFRSIMNIIVHGIIFLCIVFFAKNEVTYYQHNRVLEALREYAIDEFEAGRFVPVELIDSMEDYNKTLFRFWDWGYKNIVDAETLKLIEPYIKQRKKHGRQ